MALESADHHAGVERMETTPFVPRFCVLASSFLGEPIWYGCVLCCSAWFRYATLCRVMLHCAALSPPRPFTRTDFGICWLEGPPWTQKHSLRQRNTQGFKPHCCQNMCYYLQYVLHLALNVLRLACIFSAIPTCSAPGHPRPQVASPTPQVPGTWPQALGPKCQIPGPRFQALGTQVPRPSFWWSAGVPEPLTMPDRAAIP